MKPYALFAMLVATFSGAAQAHALCGDVTGDSKKTTADALAVLRSAVGQDVPLVCTDTTPSRVQFYNGIDCVSGSDISELRFIDSDENYMFTAGPGQSSNFQTVDDTQIDDIEIDLCGDTFTFGDPFNLAPNRSYELFMILTDPDIYGEGTAYAILYDLGIPAVASLSGEDAAAVAEPMFSIGRRK